MRQPSPLINFTVCSLCARTCVHGWGGISDQWGWSLLRWAGMGGAGRERKHRPGEGIQMTSVSSLQDRGVINEW